MASSAPQKDNQAAASTEAGTQPQDATKKSATALEEDDEFEDFPVEGVYLRPPAPLERATLAYVNKLKLNNQNRLARRGDRGRQQWRDNQALVGGVMGRR